MKSLIIYALLFCTVSYGQMYKQTFKCGSDSYYNVYSPTNLAPELIVLYFHGLGEEGNTVDAINSANGPEKNEIPKFFRAGKELPAIYIVPQLHTGKTDWGPNDINPLFPILDIYGRNLPKLVTGLSLGGRAVHTAIHLSRAYNSGKPGYFAYAAAICGSINRPDSSDYKGTKLKMWHGALDETIKPGPDRALYKLLGTTNTEYIEYPNDGHAIWSKVYAWADSTDGFFEWQNRVVKKLDVVEQIKTTAIINGYLFLETDKGFRYTVPLTKIR